MTGTWAYTESTNTVVVTVGTEGTPATFADFVTADRAGTGTELLAAETCTVNHTLTYQVRPVEDLAITLKFILSGTSAGAGDTLDVTGTDWDGVAQGPESIDVSAGDGTYSGANKWRTITDIDCTGWADGTLQVTQDIWGVIWDHGNAAQYSIDSSFDIGNNSTTTFFESTNEQVFFADSVRLRVNGTGATLTMGELSNSHGRNGSAFSLWTDSSDLTVASSTFNMYGSFLYFRLSATYRNIAVRGDTTFRESTVHTSTNNSSRFIMQGPGTHDWQNKMYIQRLAAQFSTGATFSDVAVDGASTALRGANVNVTPTGVAYSNATYEAETINATVTVLDPTNHIVTPLVAGTGTIEEAYTCNIKVVDRDGAAIESATVLCEDTGDNQIFSVSTDASGDIAEQNVNYKSWTTTDETLTDYSPHKFTISKAGYETLILEAITVDAPIVWHLELKGPHAIGIGSDIYHVDDS